MMVTFNLFMTEGDFKNRLIFFEQKKTPALWINDGYNAKNLIM